MTLPIVVLSHCLADRACRYDGQAIRDPIVAQLQSQLRFIPVCPEVEIGLSIPRDPILIAGGKLVQPTTGKDVTDAMRAFARRFLDSLEAVDGFLLKARSPSCGVRDTKIFGRAEDTEPQRLGSGIFADEVLKRYPDAAVEDESRLADPEIREAFLSRVRARAEARVS